MWNKFIEDEIQAPDSKVAMISLIDIDTRGSLYVLGISKIC